MTIEDVEDRVRTYSPAEDERLATQLLAITADCHAGKLWPITIDLLCSMHRRLFDGVRDHAGRFRAHAFGDEHLIFGPNRSVHRDRVLAEIEEVFQKLHRSVQSFRANPEAPDYEQQAVHVAVWAHAQIVGLGLPPIVVEAVKQEYNEALNLYFRTNDIQVLVDLMLQLVE